MKSWVIWYLYLNHVTVLFCCTDLKNILKQNSTICKFIHCNGIYQVSNPNFPLPIENTHSTVTVWNTPSSQSSVRSKRKLPLVFAIHRKMNLQTPSWWDWITCFLLKELLDLKRYRKKSNHSFFYSHCEAYQKGIFDNVHQLCLNHHKINISTLTT